MYVIGLLYFNTKNQRYNKTNSSYRTKPSTKPIPTPNYPTAIPPKKQPTLTTKQINKNHHPQEPYECFSRTVGLNNRRPEGPQRVRPAIEQWAALVNCFHSARCYRATPDVLSVITTDPDVRLESNRQNNMYCTCVMYTCGWVGTREGRVAKREGLIGAVGVLNVVEIRFELRFCRECNRRIRM